MPKVATLGFLCKGGPSENVFGKQRKKNYNETDVSALRSAIENMLSGSFPFGPLQLDESMTMPTIKQERGSIVQLQSIVSFPLVIHCFFILSCSRFQKLSGDQFNIFQVRLQKCNDLRGLKSWRHASRPYIYLFLMQAVGVPRMGSTNALLRMTLRRHALNFAEQMRLAWMVGKSANVYSTKYMQVDDDKALVLMWGVWWLWNVIANGTECHLAEKYGKCLTLWKDGIQYCLPHNGYKSYQVMGKICILFDLQR